MDEQVLKYIIQKPIWAPKKDRKPYSLDWERLNRQYVFQNDYDVNGASEFQRYFGIKLDESLQEPFALLHNH